MHVLGVEVVGEEVDGLVGGAAPPGAPRVVLERTTSADLERWWSGHRGPEEVVLERRSPAGLVLRVVARDGAYRLDAPGHGVHVVAEDGGHVLAAPEAPSWRWQRVLLAAVLPLAATLRGVELLHAAGVVLHGGAVGIAAPSGGGKTTTAAHLRLLGAAFLTDDVLACTCGDGAVVAHPGPGLQHVAQATWEGLGPRAAELGVPVGRDDKLLLRASEPAARAELTTLVMLERRAGLERASVVAEAPTLAALARHAYVPLVRDPTRLAASLRTWEAIARRVVLLRARVPAELPAGDVAVVVADAVAAARPAVGAR